MSNNAFHAGRQNRAGRFYLRQQALGLLLFFLIIIGCSLPPEMTAQEKMEYYDCWWGCENTLNETGWCCRYSVPKWDADFFDCHNAGNRVVKGAVCPP